MTPAGHEGGRKASGRKRAIIARSVSAAPRTDAAAGRHEFVLKRASNTRSCFHGAAGRASASGPAPPCRLVPAGCVAPLPPWGCGPHAPPKESGNLPHCHPLGGRSSHTFFSFFKKRFYLFIFRERGREGERRERNISVWLPLVCPLLGTWPTTQACAPTGDRTGDPLVHRPVLNPLSHTSQSYTLFF